MLRERLKVLTKPFHDELETNVYGKKIFSKTISKEEYCRFLAIFHSVVSPLEELFVNEKENFERHGICIENRAKTEILEADLSMLGCIAEKESAVCFSPNSSFESLVGYMYVLEGSTMGGQMLAKELKAQGLPFGYFLPYGENTMRMWQEFIHFLESCQKQQGFNAEDAILSACALFLEIGKSFRRL